MLGAELIQGGRVGYRLAAGPDVVVDLDAAAGFCEQAEGKLGTAAAVALAAAERAHELLSAGTAIGEEQYADWAEPAREQVRVLLRRVRLAAAEASLATGDPRRAASYAEAAVAADPLDEAAHRWYMSAAAEAGEQAKALAAYEALRQRLGRELGADPAPQTRELHLAILREQDGGLARSALGRVPPRGTEPDPDPAGRAGSGDRGAAGGVGRGRRGPAGAGHDRRRGGDRKDHAGRSPRRRGRRGWRHRAADPLLRDRTVAVPAADRGGDRTGGDQHPDRVRCASCSASTRPPRPACCPRSRPSSARRRPGGAAWRWSDGAPSRRSGPSCAAWPNATRCCSWSTTCSTPGSRRWSSCTSSAASRRRPGSWCWPPSGRRTTRRSVPRSPRWPAESKWGRSTRMRSPSSPARPGRSELAERILEQTRGHTLFVVEVLRALASGEEGVPESLRTAVQARVRRAGPPVEALLRAAAVLGATVDPLTLGVMLDLVPATALELCETALGARLLVVSGRDYEFANDLIREVLYASTPEPTRLAYHRRAADLLTASRNRWPGTPRRRVTGCVRAGPGCRPARMPWAGIAASDAAALATQALEAAERVADTEVSARALVLRGRALEATGAHAAALADLTRGPTARARPATAGWRCSPCASSAATSRSRVACRSASTRPTWRAGCASPSRSATGPARRTCSPGSPSSRRTGCTSTLRSATACGR